MCFSDLKFKQIIDILKILKAVIQAHLDKLVRKKEEYFPDLDTSSLQGCQQTFLADEDHG